MKDLIKYILLMISLLSLSCHQQSIPESFRWSPQTGDQLPFDPHEFPTEQNFKINIKEETINRSQQVIATLPVRNSWVQTVHFKGEIVHASGQIFSELPEFSKKKLIKLEKQKDSILEKAIKNFEVLKSASFIFDPRLELELLRTKALPVWVITYFNEDESAAYEMVLDHNLKLKSRRQVSHHLAEGRATVYPDHPEESELTEIILHDMLGDGNLNSSRAYVHSMLPNHVFEPKMEFKYSPDDTRFHEVQAYYYVDKALTWLKNELDFVLPFKLDVKVHVGAPKVTNAMFYYDGRIRLGQGDSLTYKDIPKDPSIVMHETMHSVVDAIAKLPFDGEAGSLNEGFADFLAANILNNPKMAEYAYIKGDYKRIIKNDLHAFTDFDGNLYHDSLVVSGTLWDIREVLGAKKCAQLSLRILARLGPTAQFTDFYSATTEALQSLLLTASTHDRKKEQNDATIVAEILKKRGWKPDKSDGPL